MPLPILPVQVELDTSLCQSMHSTGRFVERLHATLPQRLNDLMDQLGVPGRAELGVTVADAGRPDSLPATLHVNHYSCSYSWEITRQAYCYVSGDVFDGPILPEDMADRLRVWFSQAEDEGIQTQVIELINMICVEAIKRQPSVLLAPNQVNAYREQIIALSNETRADEQELTSERLPTAEWLKPILDFALDHKLSIAASDTSQNSEITAALLLRCWQKNMTPVYATEELMDALVPKSATIAIHFAPGYLREVTDWHDTNAVGAFDDLRLATYDRFGVSLSGFRFVDNPTLKQRSFAIGINAHLLQPWVGLPAPADPPSELSTPQAQLETIVRALDTDLSANLRCLFPRWSAEDHADSLKWSFPTLLKMVKDRFNPTQQARVLRALLVDQISLRNLRLILERMLDYEGAPDDLDQFSIFVRAAYAASKTDGA